MNFKVIKTLYKKEILDVLRDKKTVIMMLIVPLVLYPLMLVFGMQIMTSISTSMSEREYRVAIDFEDKDGALTQLFANSKGEGVTLTLVQVENKKEALLGAVIDAYVELDVKEGKPTYTICYLSANTNSSYATDMVIEILQAYELYITDGILKEAGLDTDAVINPINVEFKDMSTNEESAGNLLGTILPFMLVVSLLMGTMYPAIDTTAGERERGTLETVLTLPVTNQELFFSKFLTVATIGIVSATLNILSMVGVGAYMYKLVLSNAAVGGVDMARFIPAILVGILCVLAFAVFISAISMCVCVFAKSYKEANNYITPLTLIVMFGSIITIVPNVELTSNMALMPVANICLLIRDLLVMKFNMTVVGIVLISNVIYGILAVMLLGKLYNSEAILFGEAGGAFKLFEKRSNLKKGGVASIGDVILGLAVSLLLMIYVGGLIQVEYGFLGVVITQLIILAIPMLIIWYTKRDFKKTFKLRGCSLRHVVGGVITLFGGIMIGMVLTAVAGTLFKSSAVQMQDSMNYLMVDNFFSTLLLVAVLPAICEEMMFRGFVLSSLEVKNKAITAIVLTGVLFGAYHMNIVQFFATALLGILMCYMANVSGSILPGMIMHFMNNGLSCLTLYYPNAVNKVFPIFAKGYFTVGDILVLMVAGGGLMLAGIKLSNGKK